MRIEKELKCPKCECTDFLYAGLMLTRDECADVWDSINQLSAWGSAVEEESYWLLTEPLLAAQLDKAAGTTDEQMLLTSEEQDACTPTKEELDAYMSEPDDAVAASISDPIIKRHIGRGILYGSKISKTQLAKAAPIFAARIEAAREAAIEKTQFEYNMNVIPQAVKEAYKKGVDDSSECGQMDAQKAVIAERKRIGEWLDKIGPYDGWRYYLMKGIKALKSGQPVGGEQ